MGVQCRLTFYSANAADAEEIAQAAFARISEIDAAVSDYRVDSDVARLVAAAGNTQYLPIAPDTQFLLEKSLEIARVSGGAFDPTVGPITKLWRNARAAKSMPDDAILKHAAGLVDYREVEVSRAPDFHPVARLARKGMSLDFGAIGKGYAAEEAVKTLRSRGVKSCLVALSGDIFAGDAPPGEPGWKVDIVSGQGRTENPDATVLLANGGLSTSGDTEQFIDLAGVHYSHIIDPREGWAITERRSITVIGPHGWMTDGVDTPMCVLEEPERKRLLENYPGCAAVVFELVDGKVKRTTLGDKAVLDKVHFNSE